MIYCVKIRQRKLPRLSNITYFPFDRFYLMPRKDRALADKMFRYFFYMDLSDHMTAVIRGYTFEHLRLIPAVGRPVIARGVDAELTPVWEDLLSGEYILIVPTYPQRIRHKDSLPGEKTPAVPAYYMTRALKEKSNPQLLLPQIGIHTPTRDIPLICAVCRNYIGYCENECSPGRGSCKTKIDIPISIGDRT